MDPLIAGVSGILVMILLLVLRMNIGFAMGVVGFAGFALLTSMETGISMVGMVAYKTGASYTLTVIPLFILMGYFSNSSRMGYDLYQTVYRWIGFLPGGLAMATIVACAGFAAISGSSLATAAIMGMVALPEMKRFNYDSSLAAGCVAAGGTLGILIPPSTIMIIYGILTEQQIGTLFVAGILPGILLTLLFLITIYAATRKNLLLAPAGPRFSWKERIISLRKTGSVIILFLVVIGGLYTGWFSPTEAAGVGAFGAFVISLIKKRLDRKNLFSALQETALTTAMVFTILIGANILGYFMTVSRIPESLVALVVGFGLNKHLIIVIVCGAYIILGCLMEGMAIMVLTMPVVFPLIVQMGFDPIWFGVIMTLLIEMGLITPPVGINVFVISGIAKEIPLYEIFRGIVPFFLAMIVCLLLLIVFPQIALFLPQTMIR